MAELLRTYLRRWGYDALQVLILVAVVVATALSRGHL